MPDILSPSSCLTIGCETSSATALWRFVMRAMPISGRSSHARIIRLPIGVRVLSSTQSREPRFSRFLKVSTISRLRRAETSRRMKLSSE